MFFPGSTVGNFAPREATTFLRTAGELIGPGGGLVIGFDLRKDPDVLLRAYNDAAGVTAEFNRNMLVHINRRLGPVFDPGDWNHRAVWNDLDGRVEMHLVADRATTVILGARSFAFDRGAAIVTEYSYKYRDEDIRSLLGSSGYDYVESWTDAGRMFEVVYARVMPTSDQQSLDSAV